MNNDNHYPVKFFGEAKFHIKVMGESEVVLCGATIPNAMMLGCQCCHELNDDTTCKQCLVIEKQMRLN